MRAGTNGAPTYDYDNIQRLEYSYDAVGNITQLIDRHAPDAGNGGLQTATYAYDDLNRLRTAAYAGVGYMGQRTYDYDLTGNLEEIYVGATPDSVYSYGAQATTCPHGNLDKQHAATSVTLSNNTVRSYCYDHNGNLTRRVKDGNTDTFTYDHENRLTQVTRGGSALAQYAYDGDGQRVGSAAPTYLLVDHLGSTRYVLDNSAQTLSAQRYFPWGSTHFATDANALPRRQYTGQMNDGDTGLYYYNARYYEPGLARFIQADTIVPEPGNPQMLNRYTYVRNNPLKYNDPSGHDIMLVGGWSTSDWDEVEVWKEWIMAYKDWDEDEWNANFYIPWYEAGTDEAKQRLIAETGVHIFRWGGTTVGSDDRVFGLLPQSITSTIEDGIKALEYQMTWMQDITLVGHSKGANLVLSYLAAGDYNRRLKNVVTLSGPSGEGILGSAITGVTFSRFIDRSAPIDGPTVVNVYNPFDPVNHFGNGAVTNAINHIDWDHSDLHSRKGAWAVEVLVVDLQVSGDHNARTK